jgi:hypothetical protein
MKKLKIKYRCTKIQQFFIERTIELLSPDSLDSFRLKIHNPKSLVRELRDVAIDYKNKKLKRFDYVANVAEELSKSLKEEHCLNFGKIDEDIVLKKLKKCEEKHLIDIIYITESLLKLNENYSKHLTKEIITVLISNFSNHVKNDVYDRLDTLIQFLYVEFLNLGYSKFYLNQFCQSILLKISNKTFFERFLIIKKLIDREDENFEIVFSVMSKTININQIDLDFNGFSQLTAQNKNTLKNKSNPNTQKYLRDFSSSALLKVELKEKDYYKALERGKEKLLELLDLLRISISGLEVDVNDKALVIGSNDPQKAKSYSINFKIEGHYNKNIRIFRILKNKIDLISSFEGFDIGSKRRITSSLRYLRKGYESSDLESKLLHYWIGLEYLYSYDDFTYDVLERIADNLSNIHSIYYLRRNLNYFHREIKWFNLDEGLKVYNQNLKYLLSGGCLDTLIKQTDYPIISNRSYFYKNKLNDGVSLKKYIHQHSQNLKWNIARCYRIRNQVVHNASIEKDINRLVSHMHYYLSFSIIAISQYLIDNKARISGEITLEDVFTFSKLEMESLLIKSSLDPYELIKFKNPAKYIT